MFLCLFGLSNFLADATMLHPGDLVKNLKIILNLIIKGAIAQIVLFLVARVKG